MSRDLIALVALLQQPYATWPEIAFDVAVRGSAVDVFAEKIGDADDALFGDPRAQRIWDDAEQTVRSWEGFPFQPVTVLDSSYPVNLLGIHEVPPILFVRGALRASEVGVSVVGTRSPSTRGIRCARDVARGLSERGIAVVSGLAAGIDRAAHTETLAAGGRPIGVIGTGILRTYPRENAGLHFDVASAGALVSQFWPDAPPSRQSFPMRNVVMSGLGFASVVVEAGEKSGTRIQARVAVKHGRPVILTRDVYAATEWARVLAGRPGVYVADSVAQILDIVDALLAADSDGGADLAPELLAL